MRIWGQGARGKTRDRAGLVVVGGESQSQSEVGRLIEAFGDENQQSEFDWDEKYGEGSDVLHFVTNNEDRFFD